MGNFARGMVRWVPVAVLTFAGLWAGCARMPYTTKVLHQDKRVAVSLQEDVKPTAYTHPVTIDPQDLARILRGFSIREEQRLPLRWFAEEVPPKLLFREDELAALVFPLSQGLAAVSPAERVHFELFAPGMNPAEERDVTAGWVAVKEPYLYLDIEYFHAIVPTRKIDNYYMNNPLMPPLPKNYLLFFEPGRLWTKQQGTRVLNYREFLKTVPSPPAGTSRP
ncbi:MAG TPA: hypothetical protein VFS39_03210 [Nitrospira sp.]|nr:hypothetical protein [Nitrospira sp.]